MAPFGKKLRRPRTVPLNAKVQHQIDTGITALNKGVREGGVTKKEMELLSDLSRRFLAGQTLSIAELVQRSKIIRKITGLPLPVGSIIFANNSRFIPEDLHLEHLADTKGKLSCTRWLQRIINEEAAGIPAGRIAKHQKIRKLLRAYLGNKYRDVIADTIHTRRQRDILSCEMARPDFRHTFNRKIPRSLSGKPPLPGSGGAMRPRDPEALLQQLYDLNTHEIAHFVHGSSMRTEIREALADLIQSGPAKDLARRTMDIGAYRPTRINAAYIGHMKGVLFEVLMRERQFELLLDAAQSARRGEKPLLILGPKARLFDKKLMPSVDMSDGVIGMFKGRPHRSGDAPPSLSLHQIHEQKSGFSGDIQAYRQTAKWTSRLAELAEFVIPANALIYRVQGSRVVGPFAFSDILRSGKVKSRYRGKLRSRANEGLRPGAIDNAAWVFGQTAFDAHGGRLNRRALRGKLTLDDNMVDPVFLANSDRRMTPEIDKLNEISDIAEITDPKLAKKLRDLTPEAAQKMADDDLASLFPDQLVAPEIMPNFVAEELEFMAVRVLELVARRIFKSGDSDLVELTPQVLAR